jgi:predicted HD superfamily hydrolase involved in NAD metabolism
MQAGQVLLTRLSRAFQPTGHLARDMAHFLHQHGLPETAGHCAQVAAEAKRLAADFGADPVAAEAAGLLHDISAVIPNAERIAAAHDWDVPVLAEEAAFPMIIHQKLSVVLARALFGVHEPATLSAIGCHTTLKASASQLDKVVFIADKIRWDQPGVPPYLAALESALADSLDAGVFVYLDYLWQQRTTLRVVHPWLVAAHQEVGRTLAHETGH